MPMLYDVRGAAEQLLLSERQVWYLISKGKLRASQGWREHPHQGVRAPSVHRRAARTAGQLMAWVAAFAVLCFALGACLALLVRAYYR